jgi:hypothetical protein
MWISVGLNSESHVPGGSASKTPAKTPTPQVMRQQPDPWRSPVPEPCWTTPKQATDKPTAVVCNGIRSSNTGLSNNVHCKTSSSFAAAACALDTSAWHPAAIWPQKQQQPKQLQQTPERPSQPLQMQPGGPAASSHRTPEAMLSYLLAGNSSAKKVGSSCHTSWQATG